MVRKKQTAKNCKGNKYVPFLLPTIFHYIIYTHTHHQDSELYFCHSKDIYNGQDLTFEPGVSTTITHTFSLILHLKCFTGIFAEVTASVLGESVGFLVTAAAAVEYSLCI